MINNLDFSLFYHTIPSLIQTKPDACVNVFPTCYPWKINRGKDKMPPFQVPRLEKIQSTRCINMYLRSTKLSLTNCGKMRTIINSTGNLSKRLQSPPSNLHINIAILLAREHPVWLYYISSTTYVKAGEDITPISPNRNALSY